MRLKIIACKYTGFIPIRILARLFFSLSKRKKYFYLEKPFNLPFQK